MRKVLLSAIFIFALAVIELSAQAASPVSSLSWMAGCWEMNKNGRVTTERWAKPTENLMLGTSQTVKDGKTAAFEFLRVVNNGHGLIYVAQPSDAKAPTAFAAVKSSPNEVTFENLKHDFPQRIIYRLESADSLFARIEGMQNEKLSGIDFPMKRVKCE
ncbi:MAG: DUF6265 family protein [Pyrinomonadaceae bacterium]